MNIERRYKSMLSMEKGGVYEDENNVAVDVVMDGGGEWIFF